MMKLAVLGVLVAGAGGFGGAACAQAAPDNADKFEVASIRPARPGMNPPGLQLTPGGGLRATSVTVNLLIQFAYGVPPQQLSGGPRWADSEPYDINAKGPEGGGAPTQHAEQQELARKRLRALLAERFQLTIHRESKETSDYALVVAKGGPKFTATKFPEDHHVLRQTRPTEITGEGTTLDGLAKFVGARVGQTVVNRTGLTDRYDFKLSWAPESGQPGDATNLTTALEDQLGLKLQAQRLPTDFLTIEHVEKPSAN